MSKKSGLREVDCEYPTHLQMWEEIDACNKGAKAVLALVSDEPPSVYLPYCNGLQYNHLDEESQALANSYTHNRNLASTFKRKAYWTRGRFFNALGKTIDSLHGMIHNYQAVSDLSPQMTIIAENITGSGQPIEVMEKVITYQLIKDGRYGGLSDMASTDRQLTGAEQDMPEFRPRVIGYEAKQILRVIVMGGSLVDIRLDEPTTVKCEDDEFSYKCVRYTRRLNLQYAADKDGNNIGKPVYHNTLYDENDDVISQSIPRANGQYLTEIPFVFYGSDANTPEYSTPPVFDIAHLNLGHFSLDCDNRNAINYHCNPMTVVTTDMDPYEFNTRNPAGIDSSADGKNQLKQGDDLKLVQMEATGAAPSEMLRDQDRMVMAGAQLIMPNSSTMTLGQKRIETGSSMSTLGRISHNASAGIEKQLEYLAMFAGAPLGDTYKVNSKFITDEMTPELLNAHVALVQSGALPASTLGGSARAAGLTKLDDDQIKEKLMEESESLTGTPEEVALLQAEIDALKEQLASQE